MFKRSDTIQVNAGGLKIGGDAPVSIQSMLNKPALDFSGNVKQAKELVTKGCELIRIAIPNKESVKLIEKLKSEISVPIVADIHFDYSLAIESAAAGVDKIRINPGNIGDESRIKQVVSACKARGIPIRIGVNAGSLEKHILAKFGAVTPEAILESGLYHVSLLEKFDFYDIVLSLKASDVQTMYKTYELAAERTKYPLHLGVTEAGTERMGLIRSSAGIGGLLLQGIGNTIRVSLTDDPVKEVSAAKDILRSVGLRNDGVRIVSCPTCGRTQINIIELSKKVEEALKDCKKPITVAIMGCVVNGPGEAKSADIGIAGGNGCAILIKKGEIIRKIKEESILNELIAEIDNMDV